MPTSDTAPGTAPDDRVLPPGETFGEHWVRFTCTCELFHSIEDLRNAMLYTLKKATAGKWTLEKTCELAIRLGTLRTKR